MNDTQSETPAVRADMPDWTRERPRALWDPSRRLLQCQRRYQAARARSGLTAKWLRKWRALQHRFWSLVTQAEIPLNCEIGGGLKLPHPNGVVIHPGARIGPNCIIFQQVTLGTSSTRSGVPEIGGGVELGAGARVLGSVKIGDHAIIGANAVVTHDIPEAAIAVGIPARVIAKRW
ncbi:MAG: serine O-acetyltransferase [Pseudomonadota bacterium]|uniref:serine O-acetyltransferase n=1 Tax=Roseovarius salincola TaxID=2978479 RepID=UPI0022A68C5A|nr:serine acetyltransferase [Roseovarius sp. EGI FJ00037]MCZ0811236.1 serine acetyltransferase [Roseovarius sp. EGI FJ00037]